MNPSDLIQAEARTTSVKEKYQVKLPDWSGPYDILLKVIDEQNLNLLDLDISILLGHYLEYIQDPEKIDIDEAGEFLVVASTLAQIKSRLLLPQEEKIEEEEIDPREELVRYLQEYQKIKRVAAFLRDQPLLGRDVFAKGAREAFQGIEGQGKGTLFQLVKGFQKAILLARKDEPLDIDRELISVSQRIKEVYQMLQKKGDLAFDELLAKGASKSSTIASFLSVLELVRLKGIRIYQVEEGAALYLKFIVGGPAQEMIQSEFDKKEKS